MIRDGIILPYFDLGIRGNFPLVFKPFWAGKEVQRKWGQNTNGVDHGPFEITLSFSFIGNSYFETWKGSPGLAKVEINWHDGYKNRSQEVVFELTRQVTKEYWDNNWQRYHWLKNKRQTDFFMPPIYKTAFCPRCANRTGTLYMAYGDKSGGWACESCYQPEMGRLLKDSARRISAAGDLLSLLSERRGATVTPDTTQGETL